jgi:hypothetical protein
MLRPLIPSRPLLASSEARTVCSPYISRRLHTRPSRIHLRTGLSPASRATSDLRPPFPRSSAAQRNMSSPADHQPSKKPMKEPPVPRPSSRYQLRILLHTRVNRPTVSFSSHPPTKSSSSTASRKRPASPPHTSSLAAPSPRRMTAQSPPPTTQAGTKTAPHTASPRSARHSKNAGSCWPRARRAANCSLRSATRSANKGAARYTLALRNSPTCWINGARWLIQTL